MRAARSPCTSLEPSRNLAIHVLGFCVTECGKGRGRLLSLLPDPSLRSRKILLRPERGRRLQRLGYNRM